MKRIIHRMAHKLGWYYGVVVSFHVKDDLYIGFKCSTCGEINLANESLGEIYNAFRQS